MSNVKKIMKIVLLSRDEKEEIYFINTDKTVQQIHQEIVSIRDLYRNHKINWETYDEMVRSLGEQVSFDYVILNLF